jgi:CheY-like chemotaxis protein
VEYFVIDSGASAPLKSSPHKPRVLLVDDYDDAREMYAEYLKFSGFETVQAASGPEAVKRALESQPDIVVMDLSLPVMDGWEATRRLKADERTAAIPILALSGHALTNLSQRAKQAGFDGFVAKPCLPEDLIAEIRKVLDSYASPAPPLSG